MKTPLTPKAIARNLRVAEALNHMIVVVSEANREYWSQPLPDLLAEMNADVDETQEKFVGTYELALALNTAQDRLGVEDEHGHPVFLARAPVTRGRTDIDLDPTTGRFVVIAPAPEPEPLPDPGP